MQLEINFHYRFSQLKAGDKFAWEGDEYEKIAGNTAVHLATDKVVEIGDVTVFLYERY